MTTQESKTITVSASVKAPVSKVWQCWNTPSDIIQWNTATPEWHTPKAEHDFRVGGKFKIRMEARDGSMGFDFEGVYDAVELHKYIEYTIGDGRKVKIHFAEEDGETKIIEEFEAEDTNPLEMQRNGWQAIMDNFKKYVESKK